MWDKLILIGLWRIQNPSSKLSIHLVENKGHCSQSAECLRKQSLCKVLIHLLNPRRKGLAARCQRLYTLRALGPVRNSCQGHGHMGSGIRLPQDPPPFAATFLSLAKGKDFAPKLLSARGTQERSIWQLTNYIGTISETSHWSSIPRSVALFMNLSSFAFLSSLWHESHSGP